MEDQILYGCLYTDEENGDQRVGVYRGVFLAGTQENIRNYPVVYGLGNVNLTQRYFLKSRKFPRKIERIEDTILSLNDNTQLRRIEDILLELGHPQEFIDMVRNTVVTTANNEAISTHERWENKMHRYGALYTHMLQNIPEVAVSILTGKVSF